MWRNLDINKNLIKAETGRAVLIALPHNSDYDGYAFWHPAKLVREGKHTAAVSIGYTEDFIFNLKKYGKENAVLDTTFLSYDELEDVFGVVNDNISAPRKTNVFETHKPQSVEAVESEADESLIDNE